MQGDRGALMHEVLLSCGEFEKDFAAALDSGKGGGETIRVIFEEKLVAALRALNMREFYSAKNVKAVIDAADGYVITRVVVVVRDAVRACCAKS